MSAHDQLEQILYKLLKARYHGSAALSGFRFQLLYSTLRILDLYDAPQGASIIFEGIEDIDLKAFRIGNHYIQAKFSINKHGWGWLIESNIIGHFIEVWKLDPTARFTLVINFSPTGDLAELKSFLDGKSDSPSSSLNKKLTELETNLKLSSKEINRFWAQFTLQQIDETEIIEKTRKGIIEHLQIFTGNEDLYLTGLFRFALEHAVSRAPLTKSDIQNLHLDIQNAIAKGPENPAVQHGWIELVDFEKQPSSDDFYAGKSSRPSHIAAGLDIYRERWISKIDEAFSETPVCVIRASSGQGKSTLLYRYAFDHFDTESVFILRAVKDASMVEPIVRFVRTKLILGKPLLILIDDLSENVRGWSLLASELVDEAVLFLIAVREENWFRYSGELERISWTTIFPELEFDEAKAIYAEFSKRGKIAEGVKSAAWAFEQVREHRLLIEYVFLITQGQMLEERLAAQVKNIHFLGEDPAKLAVLRLISLAQLFDITIYHDKLLASAIDFRDDPEFTLHSLDGEYLNIIDNKVYGLHFVRSQHLVTLLHPSNDITKSLELLIGCVDDEALPELTYRSATQAHFLVNLNAILDKLVVHVKQHPHLLADLVKGLFRADEHDYVWINQNVINQVYSRFGADALLLFASATLPTQKLDILNRLGEIAPSGNFIELQSIAEKMPDRQPKSSRLAYKFLTLALSQIEPSYLINDLGATGNLAFWATYYELEFRAYDLLIEQKMWPKHILAAPIQETYLFMRMLYLRKPKVYQDFVRHNKVGLFTKYLDETNSLTLEEKADAVKVIFIVDETPDTDATPHEQTMQRVNLLSDWFPHYERYQSMGIYTTGIIDMLPSHYSDTEKNIKREIFQQMEYSELNAIYGKEIEALFSTQFLYDWLEHWYQLRVANLELINELSRRFQKLIQGNTITNTDAMSRTTSKLQTLLLRSRKIPQRFEERFKNETQYIADWDQSLSVFRNALVRSISEGHTEQIKVIEVSSLREAIKVLPSMQNAFATIIRAEESRIDLQEISQAEIQSYKELLDLLEYFLSGTPIKSRSSSPRHSVNLWHTKRHEEFKKQINSCFQPVIDEGWTVYLPRDYRYSEKSVLRGLCFAYEVLDATKLPLHISVLLQLLEAAPIDFDMVYAMPVIHATPLHGKVYQASKSVLHDLVAGKLDQSKIHVFLVDSPEAFYRLVPSVYQQPLLETDLLVQGGNILGHCISFRNRVAHIRSYLKKGDAKRTKQRMEEEIKAKVNQLDEESRRLLLNSKEFPVLRAEKEWQALWTHYQSRYEYLSRDIFNTLFYKAQKISDEGLDNLFGAYLNREYLRSE